MTEAEWLTCGDPNEMLGVLRVPTLQAPLPERKSRLFGLACCERIRHLITDPRSQCALEVVARYADGAATTDELYAAFDPAFDVAAELAERGDVGLSAFKQAAFAVSDACHPDELAESVAANAAEAAALVGMPDESLVHVTLVRDIFGNPFRPAAFDPAWRTSDVALLARGIYDGRAFDRMPILADARQEAGCTSEDILDHCRDASAVHVRGCWAVDLVLGKE